MKTQPWKKLCKFYAAIKAAIAAATVAFCSICSANAQTTQIAITNPSFETGDLTGYGHTTASGYGALVTVNNTKFVNSYNNYAPYSDPLPSPAQGEDYLNLEGNSEKGNQPISDVYQDVGALQANTTYTLTVAVGTEAFRYDDSGFISLLNGTTDAGTILSTDSISGHYYGLGGKDGGYFTNYTLSFTTHATVSGDLTFELASNSGYGNFQNNAGLDFDNVHLTATKATGGAVPEPSSVSLMLLGAAGLAWGLRRKMANS